jgi:hypothetical protein
MMSERNYALGLFFGGVITGAGIALSVVSVATAHADPMCNFSHDCGWGEPFSGQQQPVWDTPGTYGGVTSNPVLCDPYTGACRVVVPGR